MLCAIFFILVCSTTQKLKKNVNFRQYGSTLMKWLLASFLHNKPVIVFVPSVGIYIYCTISCGTLTKSTIRSQIQPCLLSNKFKLAALL